MRIAGLGHHIAANFAGQDKRFCPLPGIPRHGSGGMRSDNTGKDIDPGLFQHGRCVEERFFDTAVGIDEYQFDRSFDDMVVRHLEGDFPAPCNALGRFAETAKFRQHQADTEGWWSVRIGTGLQQRLGQRFAQRLFGKGDDPVEEFDWVRARRYGRGSRYQCGDQGVLGVTVHTRVLLRHFNTFWVNKSLHG